jgi:hypothetical protein
VLTMRLHPALLEVPTFCFWKNPVNTRICHALVALIAIHYKQDKLQ